MLLAFDCASYLWRALLTGKDKENGYKVTFNEKDFNVSSAQYGYDIAVGMMLKVMRQYGVQPRQCILVFEGMHSKRRRQAIDSTYKAKSDRPPEAYQEYLKACEMLDAAWKSVGAISMRQNYVEGDDVLAYLAVHTEEELVIATYDNDLAVLNGTNAQGASIWVSIDGQVATNKYGNFQHRFITLYKALVGDTSDEVKGCPGFGKVSWATFLDLYGEEGLEYVMGLLEQGSLDPLHEQQEDHALVRKICEYSKEIMTSFKLVQLHPEWVNTRNMELVITPGMVRQEADVLDERLKPYAGRSWLVTRSNFDELARFCRSQFPLSPFVALDIETSTPPESDEWLANQSPPNPDGVDVLGSMLTGLSLTFGANTQYTVYISVDHAETDNVTSEEVRQLVADIPCETVIQNLQFELTVLYQEWSHAQEDNGYHGFLPRALDTKFEASYVDENDARGLKQRSKRHLGYQQQTYEETCTLSGPPGSLRPGGRPVTSPEGTPEGWVSRRYKMNELPATHVFGYGCDDTICTAALHTYYKLVMQLEHTWQVYLDTEIDAAYMSAVGFLQGTDFSPAKMRELAEQDDKTYEDAWRVLRGYLLEHGWDGSICPTYSATSTPADWKQAYSIVTGKVLETSVRKPEKMAALMAEAGEDTLAALLENAARSGDWSSFNQYVQRHFKAEPVFNIGSPPQKQKLMYEVMQLPVRVRNKPTDAMKANGIREGSAKTDVLAIDWAIKYDAPEEVRSVLEALKLMQMVETRRSLYYSKYPGLLHWRTGKLHSSFNQCEANTRRSSESGPNKQQLPKHQKIEGQPARFRETIVPHHANAVIVSLDEKSQELRIIADYSKDPNMVACFVGDNKKDMHSLTAVGVAKNKYPQFEWSYDALVGALDDPHSPMFKPAKDARSIGKKVNFTTEYGAMAEKVAETLLIPHDQAQAFIDAKETAFPMTMVWKDSVIDEARNKGFVRTMMGAVRHLRAAFNSNNSYEASKAERQAVNFKVQGSAAEQTKRAYGSAWKRSLAFRYDCVFIGPIHDEVVWSVGLQDLLPFLQEMHACMIQPYGGMTIPIESSISFGPSFGEQIEVGDWPVPEAVADGLGKLVVMDPRYLEAASKVVPEGARDVFEESRSKALEEAKRAA